MTANPINVVDTLRAVQYDGTNSSDITALDPGFSFNNDSEAGGIWSFQSPPDSTSFNVPTGSWILYAQDQVFFVKTNAEFVSQNDCNITCSDFDAQVDAAIEEALESMPSGSMVRSVGVAAVPTLLLSSSANVDVQLQPAMPDTSFTAYASKFAAVSLVDLAINSVTIIDTDAVRVNVSNTGLVTLSGASVMVHAVV